ncbi:tyrosine-type recombinase/integrase [Aquisediminimonas profunda]|uniref:tyrosine-type recombinase/integrase n=1 Tax=Aquisediminimonas profunda TaxID=1550733 RepID=UPI001C637F88|nr:tyrosine-type recombinase/integrase [Aquisediminimonas profunda]
MPTARAKQRPLYRRGEFSLAWDTDAKGQLRTPYLTIFWYDPARRRVRSTSTGTAELELGKLKLDIHYLERSNGSAVCKACGQTLNGKTQPLVADAISNYMLTHGSKRASAEAIAARLAHILDYLEELGGPPVTCDAIDEAWIAEFRKWALARPVVGKKGKSRKRAPSTVENSVIQLRAALAAANRRGDTLSPPKFRAVQPAKVNNSPRWRASVTEMAAMMSYAMQGGTRTRALHRFLVASIATLARPDAVMDMSTDPARGQWRSGLKTFELNPSGRIQTKKYRPSVCVPRLLMAWLESTDGYFVRNEKGRVSSVQAAWSTMRNELGLPQECTTKSIRRSMATLLRSMHVPLDQLEMQMGHRSLNATTQIYAPDDPDYLADSLKAIETIMDQIEALAPGAFTGLAPEAISASDRPTSPSP